MHHQQIFTIRLPITIIQVKIKSKRCQISALYSPLVVCHHERTLARHGLFIPIEIALSSEDPGMRKAGAAALCSIVDMDVSLLRSHILSQQPRDDPDDDDYATDFDDDDDTGNNKRDLLQCIINRFTSEVDSGLKFQYGDILKMTLELNATPPVGALATTKVNQLGTSKKEERPGSLMHISI
jgi:hypothetical protein